MKTLIIKRTPKESHEVVFSCIDDINTKKIKRIPYPKLPVPSWTETSNQVLERKTLTLKIKAQREVISKKNKLIDSQNDKMIDMLCRKHKINFEHIRMIIKDDSELYEFN